LIKAWYVIMATKKAIVITIVEVLPRRVKRFMAIIVCPQCAKRISSQATTCNHCGFELQTTDADEQQKVTRKRLRKIKTRLTSIAFLSILLFTSGILMTYYHIAETESSELLMGNAMMLIGFISFGVVRILLAVNKKQIRANRR